MKISELLKESQQLDELKASDIGRGVGKVAKGVGAVAGGVAGIPGAVKKGFQAGKTAVAGDQEQPQAQAADPNAQQQPAAKPGLMGKLKQAAGDFKKGFQQGSGAKQEPEQTPAADAQQQPAAKPTAEPAAPEAAPDVAAIKQELTSFLQTYKKDLAMQNKNWEFVMPKVNALEKQIADLTAAKTKPASEKAKKKPSQAEINADRERVMGVTSDSVIRTGRAVTESIRLFRR